MKKFLIFLLVILLLVLLVGFLLWPDQTATPVEDLAGQTLDLSGSVDLSAVQADWEAMTVSAPVLLDEGQLRVLLAQTVASRGYNVDAVGVRCERETLKVWLETKLWGALSTQVMLTMSPAVENDDLLLVVDKVELGKVPVSMDIMGRFLSIQEYDAARNAIVISGEKAGNLLFKTAQADQEGLFMRLGCTVDSLSALENATGFLGELRDAITGMLR